MTKRLSPAAQAVWDAFNEFEAGVFVDYGDKLAAALRVAVDLAAKLDPLGDSLEDCLRGSEREYMRGKFYRFAAELEDHFLEQVARELRNIADELEEHHG